MSWFFHTERRHLVNTFLVYQNDMLAISFTSFPAEGKVPLLVFEVEGFLIFCEICRVFASDNMSPAVDLYGRAPVLTFRSYY